MRPEFATVAKENAELFNFATQCSLCCKMRVKKLRLFLKFRHKFILMKQRWN